MERKWNWLKDRRNSLLGITGVILLCGCMGWNNPSYAQQAMVDENKGTEFLNIDQQASFPGGSDALINYLSRHIVTPNCDDSKYISGTVEVSFMVDEDGSISKIKVKKSLRSDYDRACTRVVRNMPRWEPAQLKGKPVKSFYILPINFRAH